MEELVQVSNHAFTAHLDSWKELSVVLDESKLLLLFAHVHDWLNLEHFEFIPVICVTEWFNFSSKVIPVDDLEMF